MVLTERSYRYLASKQPSKRDLPLAVTCFTKKSPLSRNFDLRGDFYGCNYATLRLLCFKF